MGTQIISRQYIRLGRTLLSASKLQDQRLILIEQLPISCHLVSINNYYHVNPIPIPLENKATFFEWVQFLCSARRYVGITIACWLQWVVRTFISSLFPKDPGIILPIPSQRYTTSTTLSSQAGTEKARMQRGGVVHTYRKRKKQQKTSRTLVHPTFLSTFCRGVPSWKEKKHWICLCQ